VNIHAYLLIVYTEKTNKIMQYFCTNRLLQPSHSFTVNYCTAFFAYFMQLYKYKNGNVALYSCAIEKDLFCEVLCLCISTVYTVYIYRECTVLCLGRVWWSFWFVFLVSVYKWALYRNDSLYTWPTCLTCLIKLLNLFFLINLFLFD